MQQSSLYLCKRSFKNALPLPAGIPFAEYMDLALYHPQFGYYTAGASKVGWRHGDFFTSVHLHPLFGACIAPASASGKR